LAQWGAGPAGGFVSIKRNNFDSHARKSLVAQGMGRRGKPVVRLRPPVGQVPPSRAGRMGEAGNRLACRLEHGARHRAGQGVLIGCFLDRAASEH
jgi:hypothetical protein